MRPRTEIANLDDLALRYTAGATVADLAPLSGVSVHMLRRRFCEMGVMRGSAEANALAFSSGRMANRRTRAGTPVSDETRRKQSETMKLKGDATARGWRITSHGYVEYTRGEHAGRSFHVVAIEKKIGRRLRPDEVVHHVDRNRQNNADDNLVLMTRSAHTRLHKIEDAAAGVHRNSLGQFGAKPCSH